MRLIPALILAVLAVPPAFSRPFQAVDRSGQPVSGAVISVPGGAAVSTDAQGRADVPDGAVRVEAAGFLTLEAATGERVQLTRPSRVVVRALELGAGTAVPGGTARLWRQAPADQAADPSVPPLAELPLREGRAVFEGLESGAYRVRVEAPGFLSVDHGVAPAAEAQDEVLLRLPAASVVEGRVTAGGKPVAGARVRMLPGLPERALLGLARSGRSSPALESVGSVELDTDEAGRFRYDQLPAERRIPYLFVAQAPDLRWGIVALAPAGRGAPVTPAERTAALPIELAEGVEAVGLALWTDGEPAVGVPVVAEWLQEARGFGGPRQVAISLSPVFDEWGGGPETVSGSEGEFRLRGLPPGTWQLVARPPDHAPSDPVLLELVAGSPAPDAVRIDIVRGLAIDGLVVEASGEPVEDARVTAEVRGPEDRWPRQVLETSTDAKGRFNLSGLEPGELSLRVEASGFGRKSIDVGPVDEAERQRIVVTRTGRLFGSALNAATGEPLTRFSVAAVRAEEEPDSRRGRPFGRADGTEVVSEDGRFELEEVEEGRWAVLVRAEGYLSRVGTPTEVRAGEASDAGSIELMPGATLEGRVEDADTGEPIEGAAVSVEGMGGVSGRMMFARAGRGRGGDSPADSTGPDGRFRLDGLPPGEFTVSAVHAAYPTRSAHSQRVSIGEDPSSLLPLVTIRLERGGSVAGRVLDGSGAAVAGAVVLAMDPAVRGRGALIGGPVDADAEGRFLLEALPAGELTVRRSDRMEGGAKVTVRKGETVEVLLQDDGVRVFGSIFVGGRPAEARVRLLAGTWGAPRTDWGPTYELAGVPAGEWTLRVDVRDPTDPSVPTRDERVQLSVPEGRRELNHDIRLEEEDTSDDALVEGRVLDADSGEGLPGWLVSARQQGAGTETTRTDDSGSFRLTLKESGQWRLGAMGVGEDALSYDAPDIRELLVENGHLVGDPPVFEARRRLDLDVRVLDFAGAPLAGATCMLLNKAEHLSPQYGLRLFGPRGSVTDAFGRARVTASEPGLHDLLVILPARAFLIQPQLRVGGAEVDVQVPRTGSLEIRGVREAQLLDLPNGWWLTVRAGQDRYGLFETRGDSLFVHGLPGGSYRVRAGNETREAELVPGPTSTVVDLAD